MSKFYDHLKNDTNDIRLTDAEKSAMRARLTLAMQEMSPAPPQPRRVASPYAWMLAPRFVSVLAVALLVVVSSGTAYAAEGSLPGAPLYSVKTNVIEPLTVALATGPAAKAQANAAIADTRVQEAETLAADGSLTPAVAEQISTNYNEHAEAALALANASDVSGAMAATSTPADDASSTGAVVAIATEVPAAAPAPSTVPLAVPASAPMIAVATETAATGSPEAPQTMAFSAHAELHRALSSTTSVLVSVTPATSSATSSATSTPMSTLAQELHASLSVQAQILDRLNAEVRARNEKTPQ